jgi:hypothetical protein
MWSHHADGHRGFCLQFHIKPDIYPFRELLFKVEYPSLYPQINIVRNREDQTRKVLLTKSDFWKYEKEWRIIDDKGPEDSPEVLSNNEERKRIRVGDNKSNRIKAFPNYHLSQTQPE